MYIFYFPQWVSHIIWLIFDKHQDGLSMVDLIEHEEAEQWGEGAFSHQVSDFSIHKTELQQCQTFAHKHLEQTNSNSNFYT